MSNINNFEINKVCRTCLSSAEDMKSLYEASSTSKQICLAELLMSCTPLKYIKNDGLSTTICLNCIGELNHCYAFQIKCMESDRILRNHIKVATFEENVTNKQSDLTKEPLGLALSLIKQEPVDEDSIFEEISVKSEFPVSLEENPNLNIVIINAQPRNITKPLKDPLTIPESQLDINQELVSIKNEENVDIKIENEQDEVNIEDNSAVALGEKPYTCSICNHSYRQKQYLKVHMRKHTGENPYTCTVCNCVCASNRVLKIHMRKHTREKPYSCTVCNNAFGYKQNLVAHMKSHTKVKPYTCTVCNHSFLYKQNFKVHLQIHTGDKPYPCTICDISCKTKQHLNYHMRKHSEEKPYACTVCNNSYKLKHHLQNHLRMHSGAIPYLCPVCNRAFNEKQNLTKHMRTHTDEKPYSCTECNCTFRYKNSLKTHIRTHGETVYSCTVCNIAFGHQDKLLTHMREHTKKKPYSCTSPSLPIIK